METDRNIATVIATYSRRMRLELASGDEVEARIKGKRLRPVCGDRVRVSPIDNESDWLITAVLERDNELTRPDQRGRTEVLAANVDALVVVAAASPKPDWFVVDRYLCAAELMRAIPIVVYNKVDLETQNRDELPELDDYRAIGLTVIETSADTGVGIDALSAALENRRSILVGQSGVGKSSLINRLTTAAEQQTAAISEKRGEGRHTTVNSVMINLKNNGQVIDSPGVRDYAPALTSAVEAARGYREILACSADCRFANCRHFREPGCAVKSAVDAGTLSERRYASYRRLVNLTERLTESRR